MCVKMMTMCKNVLLTDEPSFRILSRILTANNKINFVNPKHTADKKNILTDYKVRCLTD